MRNLKKKNRRIGREYIGRGLILFDKFIELRVTYLTFLVLFHVPREFREKSQVVHIPLFSSTSLQAFPSNLASYFSPVCKNFQAYRDKCVSIRLLALETFQIPCPGRSLVFCVYLPSFPRLTVVVRRAGRQPMTAPRVALDKEEIKSKQETFRLSKDENSFSAVAQKRYS